MPTPTFIVTVGGGITASALPKRWPREQPRSWCWSGKKIQRSCTAGKVLFRGVWLKETNSAFAACSRKRALTTFPMSRPGLDCET
jgi:hypothetical protein